MAHERIRVSTGVAELDPILGGLLIGDNVIWYDDSGSLASVFALNFLKAAAAEKKPFIYVSFDRSPKNLLDKLGALAQNPCLTILDCFTFGKGKGAETFLNFYNNPDRLPCSLIGADDPQKPDSVMDQFLQIQSSRKGDLRFVFESLTGMQELWQGEEEIRKFYTHTCPRLYDLNTIGYWIVEKNAHSRRLKAAINQVAQVAIELSVRRGNTALSILKAENREIEALHTPYYYRSNGLDLRFAPSRQASSTVDIGPRIRTLRTRQGLSQAELAKQVGVTPSTISQVESSQIYPSLPALIKMAEILSVDMSAFFRDTGSSSRQVIFPESGAVSVKMPDMPKDSISARQLSGLESDAQAEAFIIEIAPGAGLMSHFFVHKGEEMGYVISGHLEMKLGAAPATARSGDLIHLRSEMPSQWKNPGPETARLLWIKIK